MKIKIITYQRIKNLGNYQSEKLEMTAELEEGEDVQASIAKLKNQVHLGLNIIPDSESSEAIDF